MSDQSRRLFLGQSGKVMLGALIGSQVVGAQAGEDEASSHNMMHHKMAASTSSIQGVATDADTAEQCATCQYWGGIRRVSKDGKQVVSQSLGWCNNKKSHHYQQMTAPNTGPMVSWKRWDALS